MKQQKNSIVGSSHASLFSRCTWSSQIGILETTALRQFDASMLEEACPN